MASSPRIAVKLMSARALGSAATRGARSHATASTKTALARTGSAVEEKNGAKTTIPLTRSSASVIAARKVVQSVIVQLSAFSSLLSVARASYFLHRDPTESRQLVAVLSTQ